MKTLLNIFKTVLLVPLWLVLIVIFLSAIVYTWCPVYRFEEPTPFSGPNWFNPYTNLGPNWYKGNFQVQSQSWGNTMDGHDSKEKVYDTYKELGYDIITISDYQHINRMEGMNVNVLPVYEHGYNIWKRHQVSIGAKKVIWLEYIFGQTHSNMQNMINTLRPHTDFLLLAHPRLRDSYKPRDVRVLSNYDALEVLNHYRNSSNVWDAALSAGKRAWLIGDDDSHKVDDPNQTGVIWTMINAPGKDNTDIIAALKAGHMYGVEGRNAENKNFLNSVKINGDTLIIACSDTADAIRFIGQDGREKSLLLKTNKAFYALQPEDTYIRTEIVNGNTRMYLNPVFRYHDTPDFEKAYSINWVLTWVQRVLGTAGLVLLVYWFLLNKKRRKK